jgi:hypothetical protein
MSSRSRTESVLALRKLVAFLDEVTDEEFDGLIRGSLCIELVPRRRSAPENPATDVEDALVAALRASTSRQGAHDLLQSEKRSKAELVRIARQLQIHVEKHDKLEEVEDKIVENVIGTRLRTEAIQGLSLKGSSRDTPSRKEYEEETARASTPRAAKDAPSLNRGALARRALRDELRNKLVALSSLLLTSARQSEWWSRAHEADIPEILEGVNSAISAFPESEELQRNVHILRSRLDRAAEDSRKGRPIGGEETEGIARALNEVAGTLMRLTLEK